MEKLFDFIGKNFVTWIIAFFGIFAPGLLTIGIFNRDLFIQLDFLKLFCLSGAICLPTTAFLFVCMRIMFTEERTVFEMEEGYIAGAMAINLFVFSIGLLCKVMYRNLSLRGFVSIICAICIIILIVSIIEGKGETGD